MNVVVIEDEQLAAERLCQMIASERSQVNVIAQMDTIKEAVDFIQTSGDEIDMLFCDIQLADGLSFKIFEKVQVKSPVVFTTAYDEYSLKAFEVNSLDYLLKPIQKADLRRALVKYDTLYDRSVFQLSSDFISSFLKQKDYKERFLVKSGSKFYNKSTRDITYFSTENKLVYLHDNEPGKRFLTDFTLDELVRDLLDPNTFFRINRQFVVNIDAIELFKAYSGQRLILQLKQGQMDELIVSREKVSIFKEWFNK